MTTQNCIAVFDMGTTSVKVCLFTPQMEMISWSVQEYELFAEGPLVEARAEEYLRAARDGMHDALSRAQGYQVAAISVTTQGETLVPVDREGNALHRFLVWLDSRAEEEAAALRGLINEMEFYRTTGLPEISGALPLAKLAWFRLKHPEIYAKTHKFLLLEDYLLWWLTGRMVCEKALATSTGWFDLNTDGYWEEGLSLAGIDPEKLPELMECGALVGPLTDATAAALGLEPGIPVTTGAMDQTAAALAGGCTEPGTVTETTGAALVLAAATDKPTFAEGHHVTVYRHALPGKFIYLPIGNTGGMALQWFRNEFCKDLPAGRPGFAALDAEVEAVPCGCEGLVFLPFLSGSVDPDSCPEAKACFFGAGLGTTRAHFGRAVMESICFLVRDFFEMLEALNCPVDRIYSLGGGSRSPLWLQMKADICHRTFRAAGCSEATAMGAALLAAWGTGLLEPGTRPQTEAGGIYIPSKANAEACDRAYRLYKNLYTAVKPLF